MKKWFLVLLLTIPVHADSDREWVDAETGRSFTGRLIEKSNGPEPVVKISSRHDGGATKVFTLDPRRLSPACQKYVHAWVNYEDRVKLTSPYTGKVQITVKRSAEPQYVEYIAKIGAVPRRFDVPKYEPDKGDPTFVVRGVEHGVFMVKAYTADGKCVATLDKEDLSAR